MLNERRNGQQHCNTDHLVSNALFDHVTLVVAAWSVVVVDTFCGLITCALQINLPYDVWHIDLLAKSLLKGIQRCSCVAGQNFFFYSYLTRTPYSPCLLCPGAVLGMKKT